MTSILSQNVSNMTSALKSTLFYSCAQDSHPKREVADKTVRPHASLQSHPVGKTSTTTKSDKKDSSKSNSGKFLK